MKYLNLNRWCRCCRQGRMWRLSSGDPVKCSICQIICDMSIRLTCLWSKHHTFNLPGEFLNTGPTFSPLSCYLENKWMCNVTEESSVKWEGGEFHEIVIKCHSVSPHSSLTAQLQPSKVIHCFCPRSRWSDFKTALNWTGRTEIKSQEIKNHFLYILCRTKKMFLLLTMLKEDMN